MTDVLYLRALVGSTLSSSFSSRLGDPERPVNWWELRVWKLDDCEFVAARTLTEAIAWYRGCVGSEAEEVEAEERKLYERVILDSYAAITLEEFLKEACRRGAKFPLHVGTDPHYT